MRWLREYAEEKERRAAAKDSEFAEFLQSQSLTTRLGLTLLRRDLKPVKLLRAWFVGQITIREFCLCIQSLCAEEAGGAWTAGEVEEFHQLMQPLATSSGSVDSTAPPILRLTDVLKFMTEAQHAAMPLARVSRSLEAQAAEKRQQQQLALNAVRDLQARSSEP